MDLTLNMDKKLDAVIAPDMCVNCDTCGSWCPAGAINERERQVEGLYMDDPEQVLPSSAGCPLGIVPQVLIQYIRDNRMEEAAAYLYKKNPLAGICASVCERYCEHSDRRGMLSGAPTDIRALERFVLDRQSGAPHTYKVKYEEKVAVIGGGPAGIAAAHELADRGYAVTIFEKDSSLGGTMSWGIPGFRLDKDMMDTEIANVIGSGIQVRTGVTIGQDMTLDQLREEYSAIVMASGAANGAILDLEGTDGDMVLDGISVLRTINLNPEDEFTAVGDRVTVIGGGRFAADVSRTLARKGKEVTCVAMEQADDLLISDDVLTAMAAEGIKFGMQAAPKKVVRSNGQVTAVEFGKVVYETDKEGGVFPVVQEVGGFTVPCDTVVFAIGREFDASGIGQFVTYPDGAVETDGDHRTSQEDVFACGEIGGLTGSVMESMVSGKHAAISVDAYLRGRRLSRRASPIYPGGSDQIITTEQMSMIRPQREAQIFSRDGRLASEPAEDMIAILRQAGIEENMPRLIDPDADDFADRRKVAVVGGGIAGITAAIQLAKDGCAPTIFEKTPSLGGRYRWLATDRRINSDTLEEELDKVAQSGIQVVCSASAGIRPSISELLADGYEAIVFAIGETAGCRPNIANSHAIGTFEIVSLASRLSRDLIINGIGDSVIVTGCDELAVDVARKLKDYARDVTLICRETRGQVEAKTGALTEALEEGVNLVSGTELAAVDAVGGKVSAAILHIIDRDLTIDVPCDTLVIGDTQKADTATIVARNPALKADERGALITDEQLQTPIHGVLSIGSCDLSSVEAGQAAAAAVENYLTGCGFDYELNKERDVEETPGHEIMEGKTMADRGFEIGRRLFSRKQALKEASRFLAVGYHEVDSSRCIGCGTCTRVCPEDAIELVPCREVEVDD